MRSAGAGALRGATQGACPLKDVDQQYRLLYVKPLGSAPVRSGLNAAAIQLRRVYENGRVPHICVGHRRATRQRSAHMAAAVAAAA
jgi:hypothetical protein